MDRVNAVICHPLYLEYYHRLERAEKERIFCRHQMSHLLDVARIAYIRNLEKGYGFRKDVIYATALLYVSIEIGTSNSFFSFSMTGTTRAISSSSVI